MRAGRGGAGLLCVYSPCDCHEVRGDTLRRPARRFVAYVYPPLQEDRTASCLYSAARGGDQAKRRPGETAGGASLTFFRHHCVNCIRLIQTLFTATLVIHIYFIYDKKIARFFTLVRALCSGRHLFMYYRFCIGLIEALPIATKLYLMHCFMTRMQTTWQYKELCMASGLAGVGTSLSSPHHN